MLHHKKRTFSLIFFFLHTKIKDTLFNQFIDTHERCNENVQNNVDDDDKLLVPSFCLVAYPVKKS